MDEFIEELSKCIGMQWKHLARKLEFNTTDIDALSHDYQQDLREQIFQFFEKWRQHEGKKANIQKLIDGLQAADLQAQLQTLTEKSIICKGDDGKYYERNEYIRSKRLQRLMSDSSDPPSSPSLAGRPADSTSSVEKDAPNKESASPKAPPFAVGDMVMVEQPQSPWHGVIRWIGTLPNKDEPIFGVEMDDIMDAGTSGLCKADNIEHFSCADGHALYLRLHHLKRDSRFDTQRDGPYNRGRGQQSQAPPPGSSHATGVEPGRQSLGSNTAGAARSSLGRSMSTPIKVEPQPASSSPSQDEILADLMNITSGTPPVSHPQSETIPAPAVNSEAPSSALVFYIPKDTAGIVIGRDGKNIRELERETNTSIQIENRSLSLAGNTRGRIIGSEENCRKALVLIAENIERRTKEHMAHTKVRQIGNAGRVIGKDGTTRKAIESLSGARVRIEEKQPVLGLAFLGIGATHTCKITGSDEEIVEAERLIDRALAGENIHAQATIISMAAVIARLIGLGFEFEGNT